MFDYTITQGYKYPYICTYTSSKNTNIIVSIFILKNLVGRYYVEVKSHRFKIHPTKMIIFKLRYEPKSLRTQCQVQNETQIRKSQKVIKNDNDELIVKIYPKDKQPFE